MIGIVGPADSLLSICGIADEMRISEACVTRAYSDPSEAPGLAQELATICRVILFSGRLPYVLASATSVPDIRLEYIPHSGTDLYRTIATLLLIHRRRKSLPKLSIDSIPARDVVEAFGDLDLDPPKHVFSLDLISDEVAFDPAELAAAHERSLRAGEVDVCVTCVGAVYSRLTAAKIPCLRVRHSRQVIREALERAHLAMLLSQAAATQIAVCIVESLEDASSSRRKRATQQIVSLTARQLAESLAGTVLSEGVEGATVIATRGVVERHLLHETGGRAQALQTELAELVRVGIGFGGDTKLAKQNAKQALIAAKQGRRAVVAFEDGVMVPVGATTELAGRQARMFLDRLAEQLGLSRTAVQRVLSVLRELGANFTARQFAAAYGVKPRSARRIISVLEERGLVELAGSEQGRGAGRPQSVFQVNTELMNVTSQGE